jgi:pyruvate formate lyase activating enzyme
MEMGVEHVYIGNVYDTPHSNTWCRGCGALLVARYGLNATVTGLDAQGRCVACGRDAHVKLMPRPREVEQQGAVDAALASKRFDWHGDVRSLHVWLKNGGGDGVTVYHRRHHVASEPDPWTVLRLSPGESYRFSAAKGRADEIGVEVRFPPSVESNLHEVFDRAHFPTVSVEEAGVSKTDVVPLPLYRPD